MLSRATRANELSARPGSSEGERGLSPDCLRHKRLCWFPRCDGGVPGRPTGDHGSHRSSAAPGWKETGLCGVKAFGVLLACTTGVTGRDDGDDRSLVLHRTAAARVICVRTRMRINLCKESGFCTEPTLATVLDLSRGRHISTRVSRLRGSNNNLTRRGPRDFCRGYAIPLRTYEDIHSSSPQPCHSTSCSVCRLPI